jgi:hypothetical protein
MGEFAASATVSQAFTQLHHTDIALLLHSNRRLSTSRYHQY